jgi:hypothetical protein
MLDVILCFVRLFYRIYLTDSRFLLNDFRMYCMQSWQSNFNKNSVTAKLVSEIAVIHSSPISIRPSSSSIDLSFWTHYFDDLSVLTMTFPDSNNPLSSCWFKSREFEFVQRSRIDNILSEPISCTEPIRRKTIVGKCRFKYECRLVI